MSSLTNARPQIPAETRRRVLLEAGHRCSIPTCRHIETEVHHIVPYSDVRSHDYGNLIALCPNCHSRADRNEIDRKSLRAYKANLRYAHDRFSQLEIDVLLELHRSDPEREIKWPFNQFIFIKRLIDAGYVERECPELGYFPSALLAEPLGISITDAGRAFFDELGIERDDE